jgi:hypothetical protein
MALLVDIRNLKRIKRLPGKPSSDTHDQIRKITLKTTTAKTTIFNRKKFSMSSGENDDRLCNMHCDT